MKAFVTGATGFIGKALAQRLIGQGVEAVCAGRSLGKLGPLSDKAKPVYLDIEDREATVKILREARPDILFHCAALVKSSSPKRLWQANVEGTRNILQACLQEGVKRVVYLSTIAVISGNSQLPLTEDLPYHATNPYGESKIEAEKIVLDYRKRGLQIAVLRPPFVYGENEPHGLSLAVKLIRWRLLPILGEGSNRLHLVGLDNLVDVMTLSIKNEDAYDGVYIVADKEALSIRELFEYMAEVLHAKPPQHIPQALVSFFASFPLAGKPFRYYLKDRVYSIERLQNKLGYIPSVSVYQGLKKALLSYGSKERVS